MKLRRSMKFALVVAAVLASSPSFGQARLIIQVYKVVVAGVVVLSTTKAADAMKTKQENPGAEIRRVVVHCLRGQRYDEDADECTDD